MQPRTRREAPDVFGVGDLMFGQYEVVDIAHGGMAVVYITLDREASTPYAIKGLHPDVKMDEEARERFLREAAIWVKLGQHPCIVTADMVKVVNDKPWIFLEYVRGGDLASLLMKDQPPPPAEQALKWALQICHGLNHAYSVQRVVHRDIKPSNVMLTENMDAKVTDFGLAFSRRRPSLARWMQGGASDGQQDTVVGSLPYMAPECFFNPSEVGVQSDIYSFGLLLYEMLTTVTLFGDEDLGRTLETRSRDIDFNVMRDVDLAAVPRVDAIPPSVRSILEVCLRYKPKARYMTFAHMLPYLEEAYREVAGRSFELPAQPHIDSAASSNNRGASLASLGRYEDAIDLYKEALRRDPAMPEPMVNMGQAHMAMGDTTSALLCFQTVLEREPQNVEALMGAFESLEEMEAGDDALAIAEELLHLPGVASDMAASVCGRMAFLLDRLGRAEEADKYRRRMRFLQSRAGRSETVSKVHAAFRRMSFRKKLRPLAVRRIFFDEEERGIIIINGSIYPVSDWPDTWPPDEKLIEWDEMGAIQLGVVPEEEGTRTTQNVSNRGLMMEMYLHREGHVLRMRRLNFPDLLGEHLDSSETNNYVQLLRDLSQYARDCRFHPTPREIEQCQNENVAAPIHRYKSLKDFEDHGYRLMVSPRRS